MIYLIYLDGYLIVNRYEISIRQMISEVEYANLHHTFIHAGENAGEEMPRIHYNYQLQTKFLIAKVLYGIHMSVITRNQFCI